MNSASVLITAFSASMDGLGVHDAWITVSLKKKKKRQEPERGCRVTQMEAFVGSN